MAVLSSCASALKSISGSRFLCSLSGPLQFDRKQIRSVKILEHNISEMRLGSVEKLFKLVNFGQLYDFHHFCRVRHTFDHSHVV